MEKQYASTRAVGGTYDRHQADGRTPFGDPPSGTRHGLVKRYTADWAPSILDLLSSPMVVREAAGQRVSLAAVFFPHLTVLTLSYENTWMFHRFLQPIVCPTSLVVREVVQCSKTHKLWVRMNSNSENLVSIHACLVHCPSLLSSDS